MRVSEKNTENSERLSRQARPGFEPGTSRLPVLSVTTLPLVGPFDQVTQFCFRSGWICKSIFGDTYCMMQSNGNFINLRRMIAPGDRLQIRWGREPQKNTQSQYATHSLQVKDYFLKHLWRSIPQVSNYASYNKVHGQHRFKIFK